MSGSDELAGAFARWRQAQSSKVEQAPGCVYGLLTREKYDELAGEVKRLNDSITTTNRLLIGLLVSIVLAVIGVFIRGAFGP